jgi:hypothetical protein
MKDGKPSSSSRGTRRPEKPPKRRGHSTSIDAEVDITSSRRRRSCYTCDDWQRLSLQKGLAKPILPIKRSMMYLAVLMGTTIVSSASMWGS